MAQSYRPSAASFMVGIEHDHFRALKRQGLFPKLGYVPAGELGERLEDEVNKGLIDRQWASYGIDELLPLRCMISAMAEGGLNASDASKLVINAWGLLEDRFHRVKTTDDLRGLLAGPEQWLGVETSMDRDGDLYRNHYAGSMAQIYLASEARNEGDRADSAGTRVRLVLVSVTGAVRFLLSREYNLPIGTVA